MVEEIRDVEGEIEASREPLRESNIHERIAIGSHLYGYGAARVEELRACLIHGTTHSGCRDGCPHPFEASAMVRPRLQRARYIRSHTD
jgi:hypothetical protein